MRVFGLLLLALLSAAPSAMAAVAPMGPMGPMINEAPPTGAQAAAAEVIAAIQVHGNVLTPEADIIQAAGIAVGAPFDAATPGQVEARLTADKRFVRVEVLKRFASIADASQITVVIIVDEGPVTIVRKADGTAGAEATAETRRSRGLQLLWFPLLRYDEGYGLSYGLRVARADVLGPKSRLSLPLTWGAERRVGLQADRVFDHRVLRRLEGGLSLARRVNPAYRVADTRRRLSSRIDTQSFKGIRADAGMGWEQVRFGSVTGDDHDRLVRASIGATVDTRVDPLLARNAVYARVARERLWWRGNGRASTTVNTTTVDLRGYLGLYRQSVLVVRAFRDGADSPLPLYERRLSGGGDVLRGFRVGYASGDVLSAGSLELRTPVGNPLNVARLGVSVFFDAAAVYDVGGRLRDQKFDRGVGAGVWLSAAVVRLNVAVARGLGRGTRVSVGTSLQF